ncbi:MAG: ATP-binding cassette domain-containing protein [Lachnospiraceae bacterium]|nr:ATP-binding cassette domain-containing protein [Lachnospiraceae bacterium]
MLELKNVSWTAEDGTDILENVSFVVPENRFVVITGPNGGGKTTTAKIIAGLMPPTSGQILFNGTDITQLDATERAKAGIGYAFQQPVRFKGITVRELIEMAAGEQMDDGKICHALTEVGLCANDYADREVNASLSGGEIKRIEIVTVLARHTELSVFDEPEAGIDLWSFTNLIEIFTRHREERKGSMLIVSHQERLLNIADEIIVIANGKVTKQGSRDEILPTLFTEDKACNACPRREREAL